MAPNTMLNVYDRLTHKKTAILQNAYNVIDTHELNQIYTLSFTLPSTDEKTKFCLPRHFVRWGEDGELYRIKAPKQDESDIGTITYECEHVITTLCDTIMFGSYQYGGAGVRTEETIRWLLSQQNQQDWVLDVCEFDRKFEYLWEQENILNALYSIPKEFAKPYKWSFDTTVYPWKVSLKAIDTTVKPEFYLRARSNILSSGTAADYANICTRIYPLGYGEGVNQLNIKDVNNGVPYIQSPQNIIDQYGIVEKVLVDRRFENAESLKAYAQSMLDVYQTPTMSRTFDVTDLFPLTNYDWNDAEVGKICKMVQDETIAYITKTQWQRDKAGDLHIDLSTKATDIASNVADLADRVRIESVYAQGATQLYQHSKDANATPTKGMIMSLYFPAEMRQINKVLLRLKLNKFRSYSQATESKTVTVKSCENVTVTVNTNEKALTNLITTKDGGGTTSSSGGTSVTVSGGTTSGNSTDRMTSGLSMSVSASGTVSLPMETTTSAPSTDVTTGTEWDYPQYTPATQAAYTGGTDGSGDNVDTDDGIRYYYEDGNSYTDGPYGSEFEGHTHTYYKPYHHYHPINGIRLRIPALSIPRGQFTHTHKIAHYHTVTVSGGASGGQHTHTFTVPNHTHSITAHSHNLPDLSHNHTITLKGHTHNITMNGHSHEITPGIFENGNPSAFDIYVGNTKKATVNATTYDGDIVTWLLNSNNQVPRNTWIDIEIRPNDLAYVVSSVFIQGFVQSRGGGNY